MSKKCKRGASCAATGEATSPLLRVVGDLYERIDFQKDTIDGLRGERRQLVDGIDDLNAALNAALDERDSALARVDMLARSGHSWAVGCEKAETALARVQAAANRAFVIASTGVGSIQDIATALAPVIPEGLPLAEPKAGTIGEIAETVREFLADLKNRGSILTDADVSTIIPPFAIMPGVTLRERLTNDAAAIHALDEVADSIRGAGLPPGFISIDVADLPASLAEKIAAQHAAGKPFAEVDAADLPRDVFRRIFGLDRQPEPEPAKMPDCFGEGCTAECNRLGCARERAEAEAGPAPHSVTDFTEAEHFMIEAAEQHGFQIINDEDGIYSATAEQIIALVKAARLQGRQDAEQARAS